jgi:hypothetical protein
VVFPGRSGAFQSGLRRKFACIFSRAYGFKSRRTDSVATVMPRSGSGGSKRKSVRRRAKSRRGRLHVCATADRTLPSLSFVLTPWATLPRPAKLLFEVRASRGPALIEPSVVCYRSATKPPRTRPNQEHLLSLEILVRRRGWLLQLGHAATRWRFGPALFAPRGCQRMTFAPGTRLEPLRDRQPSDAVERCGVSGAGSAPFSADVRTSPALGERAA